MADIVTAVGDASACRGERFRALYEEHAQPLLAYALRRVVSRPDAADVVAEALLVAWRRLDDVPAGDEARFWLLGVARRVLANQQRGELRRHRLADRLREEVERRVRLDGPADVSSSMAVPVREALARLDEHDRELLRLTSWEGLSPAELATLFGVPAATMRTRLHRARRRLRAALDAEQQTIERFQLSGHSSSGRQPPARGTKEEG